MVLVKGYRLKEIYNRILQSGNNWNCSILILVANEVDAICSAKILKTLLENDSLTFQIEPISGYEDVSIIREKYLIQGHTFRSVILINCGGLIDMRAEWELPDEFDVFIFDCMRPLNLASVHGCNDIYVVAEKDKYLATDLREAFEIFESGEPVFDSTRAINDDRYREEFEREKRSFEKSEKILENYRIQGNSYSTATALTMLHLAQSLNQVSNNTIWLAILGVTYHYQLDHFDEKVYRDIVEELREELNKLKIKTAPGMTDFKAPEGAFAKKLASKRPAPYALPFSSRSNHSFLQNRSASSTPSLESSQDSSNKSSSQDKSFTSNSSSSHQKLSKGSIHYSEELKLPHYRHWTLYEALFHSNYTSTRLGLWSESGRRKLKNLLAKMGIPLTEATQSYSYMKLNLKKNLKAQFKQTAPMYGLPELTYESFIRVFGNEFESPLSAGEAVSSMNALLKMTPSNLNSLLSEQISAPNAHDPQLPMVNIPTTDHTNIHLLIEVLKKKAGSNRTKLNEEDYEDWWKTCFWACYDSLSDSALIRAGIDLSIHFHKLILTQAFSLIQRQEIRIVKEFRLIVIKDGANLPMFHHYHTLSQLGQFLLSALQINGQASVRSSGNFPLIISSLDESRDIFNVLGLVPNNFYRHQSPLGWVFINSIELTGVRTKMDYFNPSFLQISSEDLVSFIHKLDLKLN